MFSLNPKLGYNLQFFLGEIFHYITLKKSWWEGYIYFFKQMCQRCHILMKKILKPFKQIGCWRLPKPLTSQNWKEKTLNYKVMICWIYKHKIYEYTIAMCLYGFRHTFCASVKPCIHIQVQMFNLGCANVNSCSCIFNHVNRVSGNDLHFLIV